MEKTTALDNILRFAPPARKSRSQIDAGAGDDNTLTPETQVQENSPVRVHVPLENVQATDIESPGILCRIGYLFLRMVFYLAVIGLLTMSGLYIAKLSGVYDPCQEYYVTSDTKCTVTSYMKGILYHLNCFEEQYCLLPGFWSNTSRQSWSFKEPIEVSEDLSSEELHSAEEPSSIKQ